MSTLEVGKIVPATGTAITLGESGDTLTVPSGGNLTVASGATINITGATQTGFPSGLFSGYAIFADQKTQNTAGGTFTSGAWRQRDLNTTIANTDTTNITLGTNEFTLATGNYFIRWGAQADAYCYQTTSAVHDGSTNNILSFSTYTAGSGFPSCGVGRVTVSGSQAFTIQHRCTTTRATTGFGIACNFAAEIYLLVEIFKEA